MRKILNITDFRYVEGDILFSINPKESMVRFLNTIYFILCIKI
jgi:hypothetical protein